MNTLNRMLVSVVAVVSFAKHAHGDQPPSWERNNYSNSRSPSSLPKSKPSGVSGLGSLSGTLPSDIYRVRVLHQSLFGSRGLTATSQWQSTGVDVSVHGTGLIFDIPLFSDNITLGVGLPFIYSNRAIFNAEKFAQSEVFDRAYSDAREAFINRLVTIGECATREICLTRIERGDSIPVDVKINIPDTNELYVLPAHTPIRSGLTWLVTEGGRQQSGATGIGDLEMAFRIRWLTFDDTSQMAQSAIQLGFKFPTGAYTKVPQSQRSIGRGVFEFNAAVVGDYMILPLLSLSGSYGIGIALGAGSKQTSRVIDNTKLADGNCDVAGQGNNSDGSCEVVDTKQTVTRKGIKQQLVAQANLGLGLLSETLNPLGVSVGTVYENDSIEVIGGEQQPAESLLAFRTTLNFMGPAIKSALVPIELNLEYTAPLTGRNKPVATHIFAVTTALYWK